MGVRTQAGQVPEQEHEQDIKDQQTSSEPEAEITAPGERRDQHGEAPDPRTPPPFAGRWVGAVAGASGLALLLVSTRYGFQGDELYFLGAGKHLDWGYADQPVLLPLLAHGIDAVTGGSLFALRLLPVLLTVAGALVAALTAREFGGERRAQVLTAAAYGFAPAVLISGHALSTMALDLFLWTAVNWLLIRWVRTREDRLLLFAGLATALALQGKYLIIGFWAVLAVCLFVVGPRELLRRKALWLGAAVAAVTSLPGLIWQARNDWPQLEMSQVLADEGILGGRAGFLPYLIVLSGGVFTVVLVYGLIRLLRSPQLAPYRFLAWTFLGLTAVFLVTGGRPAYVVGAFAPLWAAGAVELARGGGARWWRWLAAWPVVALTALVCVALSLPVYPVSQVTKTEQPKNNPMTAETLRWPHLIDAVDKANKALPAAERKRAVVVTQYYQEAGAVDHFGPDRDLPPAYSGHRGYWYFGAPSDSSGPVLYVGSDVAKLKPYFTKVRKAATAAGGPGESFVDGVPVWILEGRTKPWSKIWPDYGHLS
ncbi:ArnT family glycosyltransferase [Streptomyces flavofungini]|uniref:ArnT family glycosyltransferase n=1 Tax=Streptomyces flavofungini TaxID=68200 RepID=UPI0025B21BAE|nr:glycosyltransferase family 39 protein [Streptomyces flavofungini]WJV44903.1 glycosyltransferase family 39 protein [Streptomyces flavofungini]